MQWASGINLEFHVVAIVFSAQPVVTLPFQLGKPFSKTPSRGDTCVDPALYDPDPWQPWITFSAVIGNLNGNGPCAMISWLISRFKPPLVLHVKMRRDDSFFSFIVCLFKCNRALALQVSNRNRSIKLLQHYG